MAAPAINRVVAKTAQIGRSRLVKQTPKRWTGHTRRSWQVKQQGAGHYLVYNESKVMGYLEFGTRAHGPKTAKFLFVPLTRRAFNAGARKAIQDKRYKRGRDYVLTKRVKGIQARWIVRRYAPFAKLTLKAAMRLHIRNAMR